MGLRHLFTFTPGMKSGCDLHLEWTGVSSVKTDFDLLFCLQNTPCHTSHFSSTVFTFLRKCHMLWKSRIFTRTFSYFWWGGGGSSSKTDKKWEEGTFLQLFSLLWIVLSCKTDSRYMDRLVPLSGGSSLSTLLRSYFQFSSSLLSDDPSSLSPLCFVSDSCTGWINI